MSVTKNKPIDEVHRVPVFKTQYTASSAPFIEVNTLPSETVPEQGLTVQEIIARYVRTGQMPVAVHEDQGGNEAFEPGFDPLDLSPEYARNLMEEAKAKLDKKPDPKPDPEPDPKPDPEPDK